MKTVKNPKVNLDKIIVTYQYRIKDSNKKLVKSLMHKSGLVNLVCNDCNYIQQQAVIIKKSNVKNPITHFRGLWD